MRMTLKYIISLIIISTITVHCSDAQSVILPSAVRIGTDVSKLGIWMLSPYRKEYEINADIDVYKYFLACDFGSWKTEIPGDEYNYRMNGQFLRAGIDYNFLYSDQDNHVIYFGLRYGLASFDENFDYTQVRPYDEQNDPSLVVSIIGVQDDEHQL